MDGVTILSTYSCNAYEPGTIFACMLIMMVMVFVTVMAHDVFNKENVTVLCGIVIAVFIVFASYDVFTDICTEWEEYSVTLADNVSFNAFCDKYEIISTDGAILRVKEK